MQRRLFASPPPSTTTQTQLNMNKEHASLFMWLLLSLKRNMNGLNHDVSSCLVQVYYEEGFGKFDHPHRNKRKRARLAGVKSTYGILPTLHLPCLARASNTTCIMRSAGRSRGPGKHWCSNDRALYDQFDSHHHQRIACNLPREEGKLWTL